MSYAPSLAKRMLELSSLSNVIEALETFAVAGMVSLGHEDLAGMSDVSVSTVKRHLQWLEAREFIISFRRSDSKGFRLENGYILKLETEPRGHLEVTYRSPSSTPKGHLEVTPTYIKDFISLSQEKKLSFENPLWLDQSAWGDWQDYLLEKFNIVLTPTQMKLQLESLLALSQNEEQKSIISRTITSGWKTFYPNEAKLKKPQPANFVRGAAGEKNSAPAEAAKPSALETEREQQAEQAFGVALENALDAGEELDQALHKAGAAYQEHYEIFSEGKRLKVEAAYVRDERIEKLKAKARASPAPTT